MNAENCGLSPDIRDNLDNLNVVDCLLIAPSGFWPRGQNPRRHPRSPRVYTYKDKEYLLKK